MIVGMGVSYRQRRFWRSWYVGWWAKSSPSSVWTLHQLGPILTERAARRTARRIQENADREEYR